MLWAIFGSVLVAFGIAAFVITQNLLLTLFQLVLGIGLLVLAGFTSAAEIRDRLTQDSGRRSMLFGSNAVVQTGALVAVLALCAYLAVRHPLQWDWTEAGVHSLAKATKDLLARIPEQDPIEVYAFFLDPTPVREVLDKYAYESKRFSYKLVNPNKDLETAQLFEISQDQVLLVCRGPCQTKDGGKAAMTSRVTEPSEEKITQGIRGVISEKRKVYFLSGHEEGNPSDDGPQGMALTRKALESENATVATHVLATDPIVPKDADALIVAGPTRPLLESETKAIDQYLRGGGSVLMMVDPLSETRLEPLLESWGIKIGNDVIVDQQLQLFGAPRLVLDPVAVQYGSHPITREMAGRITVYKLARSVEPEDSAKSEVVKLVETSPGSWAAGDVKDLAEKGRVVLKPESDRKGPISIAVARTFKADPDAAKKAQADAKKQSSDQPASTDAGKDAADAAKKEDAGSEPPVSKGRGEGRLVVFGDADFARNESILGPQYNNDLVLNVASWLVGQEEFITIDRKLPRASMVQMGSAEVSMFMYVGMFLLPEGLILLGIAQWWRRRRA